MRKLGVIFFAALASSCSLAPTETHCSGFSGKHDGFSCQFELDSESGTVLDHRYGVLWQAQDDGVKRTIVEAYRYCSDLTLAGRNWALPTPWLLASLYETGTYGGVHLNPFVWRNPKADYWGYSDQAYVIDYSKSSEPVAVNAEEGHYIRCMQYQLSPVIGLDEGVKAIGTGTHHTCAIDAADKVWCWGLNTRGQLGDGTTETRYEPVEVQGLPAKPVAVDGGDSHTCALLETGQVACWGDDSIGQLGDYLTNSSGQMVLLTEKGAPFSAAKKLSVGALSSCVVSVDDELYCWGTNFDDRVDTGRPKYNFTSATPNSHPTDVFVAGEKVRDVAVGVMSTCISTSTGKFYCWGDNRTFGLTAPDPVTNYSATSWYGVIGFTLGGGESDEGDRWVTGCAIASNRDLYCWGENRWGQMGVGTTASTHTTTVVAGIENVSAVAGGAGHFCAVTSEGWLACWGDNSYGQTGYKPAALTPTFLEVFDDDSAVDVKAGFGHTCILTAKGAVYCMGDDSTGQLGTGN